MFRLSCSICGQSIIILYKSAQSLHLSESYCYYLQKKTATTEKQPHRLAKYFDTSKGLLCFHCKEWGHLSQDCPEKTIYKVNTTPDEACYVTGALDERPIRVQVDNGSSVTVVWSKLVPNSLETNHCKFY